MTDNISTMESGTREPQREWPRRRSGQWPIRHEKLSPAICQPLVSANELPTVGVAAPTSLVAHSRAAAYGQLAVETD